MAFYIISPGVETFARKFRHIALNRSEVVDEKILLPLNSWFPFDKSEYYIVAYTLNALTVLYGANYTACADAFFFALIIFGTGQLKILQKELEMFKEKAVCSVKTNRAEDKEREIVQTLKECVKQHKVIIKYVSYKIEGY